MKKIYKRIRVNKKLLKLSAEPQVQARLSPQEFLMNEVTDTLPAGKVVGVYFNHYGGNIPAFEDIGEPYIGEGSYPPNQYRMPFGFSHTDITLKDSRGHQLTEPTDIFDYEHKGGGYLDGFKVLDFESKNEKITIAWETIGAMPICGEFIFAIEVENCAC